MMIRDFGNAEESVAVPAEQVPNYDDTVVDYNQPQPSADGSVSGSSDGSASGNADPSGGSEIPQDLIL